uniref:Uncharacterized protein n=1 Tax=Helicotheca tamesis TaxID=374047 RepID=A0A7S2N5M5_9STRA|mmetsp:Transcript_9925/g.13888  ORF Transcript_9925/g.13888 Transcript_9925/m.13888 type:complete len:474 (+) Transcript_9925:104-1525(+)
MDILNSNTNTTDTVLLATENDTTSWSTNRWTPVYLSCLAGASTCLGAAVVFLHPKPPPQHQSSSSQQQKEPAVSNATMSFSLALAGSVMITVSVVSIGGECLQNDDDDGGGFIEFGSMIFWQRFFCFGVGCMVYLVLSKFAFPEPPEELIEQNSNYLFKDGSIVPSFSSSSSSSLSEGCEEHEKSEHMCNKQDVESGEEVVLSSMHHHHQTKRNTTKRRNSPSTSAASKTNAHILATNSTSFKNNNDSTNVSSSSSSVKSSFVAWTKGNDLQTTHQKRAWRLAMLLFLSLLLHNFPEGLAVAASALESPSLGITVTIGIMIHNIPEGIAIAIPCLAARPNSPWLSFLLASASGLAEPAGAFLALLCLEHLEPHSHEKVEQQAGGGGGLVFWSLENVLAFVAGIMITVALWELFPEAWKHCRTTTTTKTTTTKTSSTNNVEKEQVQVVQKKQAPFWFGTVLGVVIMLLTEFSIP